MDTPHVIPPELDGQSIPGGCDDCHAEQHLAQEQPGIWSIQVRHDPTCPTLSRIRRHRQEP